MQKKVKIDAFCNAFLSEKKEMKIIKCLIL